MLIRKGGMLQAFPPFKTKEVTMRTSRIFILLFVLAVWALMPVTVDAADWIKQGDEMFYFEGVFLAKEPVS